MKRIKQIDIAAEVGISSGFLSQLISGKRRPSWPVAKTLAAVIQNTTPELWLEGSPEQIRAALANQSVECADPEPEAEDVAA